MARLFIYFHYFPLSEARQPLLRVFALLFCATSEEMKPWKSGGALRKPPSSHVSVPDSFLQRRSSSCQNVPCPGAPIGSDPAWTGSDVQASGKCIVSPQNIIHNILLCQRRLGVRAIPVQTTCFDSKRTKWYGSATDHFSSNHTKLFASVLSKIRRPPTPSLSVTTSASTFSHGFEVTDCCFGTNQEKLFLSGLCTLKCDCYSVDCFLCTASLLISTWMSSVCFFVAPPHSFIDLVAV